MIYNIKKILYKIIQRKRKKNIVCAKNTIISSNCSFQGNIFIGEHCVIGKNAYFASVRAKIIIHDHVVFGPNITIYSGDHPMDVLGKHISEITESDKNGSRWDKDVVIESGCWIGTRAIILKGVTIGKGSVIGAGSVVTKDVPPYSIYVGCPTLKILNRFSPEQIIEHERILEERKQQNCI